MKYHKSLDGFRALAVFGVLGYHFGDLPFGWIGVQMFFTLSGYLITGILVALKELPAQDFFLRFYWRRTLRIWPLYYGFVALYAFTGIAYFTGSSPNDFLRKWAYYVTFTYNFSNLSPHRLPDAVSHFWTLCIEEQFYLVWPFLIYSLSMRRIRQLVVALILLGPAFRYGATCIISGYSTNPYYVGLAMRDLTTSQLDAFAFGALIAVLPVQIHLAMARRSFVILCAAMSCALGYGFLNCYWEGQAHLKEEWFSLGYPTAMPYFYEYIWGYSMLGLTSATCILCLTTPTFLTGLFENRVAVYVGKISYGMYVWHLVVLAAFQHAWSFNGHSLVGVVAFALYFAVTVLAATLSYYLFENHFLRMKEKYFKNTRPHWRVTPDPAIHSS